MQGSWTLRVGSTQQILRIVPLLSLFGFLGKGRRFYCGRSQELHITLNPKPYEWSSRFPNFRAQEGQEALSVVSLTLALASEFEEGASQ